MYVNAISLLRKKASRRSNLSDTRQFQAIYSQPSYTTRCKLYKLFLAHLRA